MFVFKGESKDIVDYDAAFRDIKSSIGRWPLWSRLAGIEMRRRYKRTVLGPLWTTMSMAVFAFAVGIVFSTLWRMPLGEFMPYLCSGLAAWILVSTMIIEGSGIFIVAEGLIKQTTLPLFVFVILNVVRNFMVFAHNIFVFVVVALIFTVPLNANTLLVLPGLALVALNGLWLTLLVGIFASRYRDVQPTISSLLQIGMLVTPIFWPPEQAAGMKPYIVDTNPIYHLVNVVRAPLLGDAPSLLNWGVTGAMALIGCVISFYVFARCKAKIVYWI